MKSVSTRRLIFSALLIASVGGLAGFCFYVEHHKKTLKIGLLHSLTGTMAASEKPLIDAATLAIEELNAKGGVLGQPIEAVIVDGQSNDAVFAQQAERLITQEKVYALFGCWTSACRKAVKPSVEKHRHILFYPLQYEGLEQSEHIVYTGLSLNQQLIPATSWALQNLGKKFYLVGSDYIFPRAANMIVKEFLAFRGGKVVKEHYLPLGSHNMQAVIAEIKALQPDVILNTINGDSNNAFFKAIVEAGFTAKKQPIISLSVAEVELAQMPVTPVGHYAAWSYFQSINTERNREFVQHFKQRFGGQRVVDDPMEATYLGIYLWAQAVESAKTASPEKINQYIIRQSLNAPQGIVSVDKFSRHLWRSVKIGQIQPDKQFKIVWQSEHNLRPQPFPLWHSEEQWQNELRALTR
jgi:urea transport system substrate-binding protein